MKIVLITIGNKFNETYRTVTYCIEDSLLEAFGVSSESYTIMSDKIEYISDAEIVC